MNKAEYPASTRAVMFRTRFVKDPDTGDWVSGWHRGFYLKDANKYVRGVNKWKDVDEHRWYKDCDVIDWREVNEGTDCL